MKNPKHTPKTEPNIIGLSRAIPGPLLLNGYAAMEFVAMLEQLRQTEGFDERRGIVVRIDQVTADA